MLRRSMLSTSALVAAGSATLAACSMFSTSAAGTVPAQIVADVDGALNQLAMVLPALTATAPPSLTKAQETPLLADVNQALGFMALVGPTTQAQTAATAMARAEGLFNAVLAALLAVPIPPPYNLIVIAANVVAPELEAYLNTLIPPPVATPVPAPPAPTPAKDRAAKVAHGMTIEKAREVLKIKAVS